MFLGESIFKSDRRYGTHNGFSSGGEKGLFDEDEQT